MAQAPLTIAANNVTRVYGAGVPLFTATITGFVNNDGPSSLTTGPSFNPSSWDVGNRTLTPGDAVDPNYNINYVAGTLTITPAQLTITVNNGGQPNQPNPAFFKQQGQPNPVFTYTATGFVNGDSYDAITVQPTCTTTCTCNSPVNNCYVPAYPVVGSGAVASNYTITYVPGYLIVQPNPPTPPPVVPTPPTPLPAPSPFNPNPICPISPNPVVHKKTVKVVHHTPVKVVHPVKVVYHPVHKLVSHKAR